MKILNKFIWSKTEPKNKNDVWFDGYVFRLFKEEEWQAFTINLQDANEVVKLKDFLTKYLSEEIIPTVEDAKEAVKTIQIYVDLAVESVRQATEAVNKAEDLTSRAETVVPQAENVVRDIIEFKDTIQSIWDNLYIEINNAISNANEAADRANNSIVFYPISDGDVSIIMGNLPRTDSFVEDYTGHTYVYNDKYGLWYLASDLSICTNVPSIQSCNIEDEGRVFVQNISYVYNPETNRYEGQGLYGKIPVRLLYDGFEEFGGQEEAIFTDDGGHNIVLKTRQQFTDAEKAQIKENLGISGSGGGVDVDSELSTTSTNPVQNKTITSKLTELSEGIDKKVDADNVATINGQSLVQGGNITIVGGEKGEKGDKGDKGDQGNSGYTGVADELEVVNNLTQGGATAALSAEMGKELGRLTTDTFEVIEDGVVKSVGYDSAVATTYTLSGLIPKNQSKYRGIKAVYFQESAENLLDWNAVAVRQNADGYFYGVRKSPMVWNAAKERYDTSLILEDGEMYAFMTNNNRADTSGKPLGQIKSAEAFASADKEDYILTNASFVNGILALDSSQAKSLSQYRGFFKHSILPMTEIYTREEGEALEDALSKKADNPKYYGVNDTAAFANGLKYKDTCSVELWCKLYKPSANHALFGGSLDQMRIYLLTDGTLRGAGYDAGNYLSINTYYKIEDGKPYHIVMAYDYSQNIVSMYINGQLRGSCSVSGNNKLITNIFTCKNSYIGYARLFGKALSADEVSTLYNYGRPTKVNLASHLTDSLIYNYEQKNLSLEGWRNSVTEGMYDMTFTSATLLENPFVNDAEAFARIKAITNYDNVIAKRYYCKFDVVSFSKRNAHDCTFVGDRIWSCNKPKDGGGIVSVNPDGTDGKQIIKTSFYDEKGLELEMKSVDFARGMLLVGNGSATSWNDKDNYDHCAYIFYQPHKWETIGNNATTAITFENCGAYTKVNLSALGAKTYAFWGAEDIIYVSCNLFNDIYMVQLGKGTYNLGSGDYIAVDANKYNGSYKVIKHWHQDGGLGEWAGHGGQFYGDSLYIATNDPTKCLVYRCLLDDDGGLRFEELNYNVYTESGQQLNYGQQKVDLKYSYIDGLCIKDGKLYAQILNVNAVQGGTNVIVADL